ncbi:MAG: polyprenyl diphosphate synthase [Patescibacteria group bacterium]
MIIPHHIAIIPDGNRRWAKQNGLPAFEGHRQGFNQVVPLIQAARKMGIHTLTLWAFSTENWNRDRAEIDYLMKLYVKLIDTNLKQAKKEGARIYHLGRKDRLPETLVNKIIRAENGTAKNTKYVLNIALDYGGQDEILRATEKIVKAINDKKIIVEDLWKTESNHPGSPPLYLYRRFLDTRLQPYPYPDLIIRTSGEQRLSGLLSWQAAYAELYFEKDHFPDFTPEKLKTAIEAYSQRQRRFGGNAKLATPSSNSQQ